jgi:hypothetical protein
MREKVPTVWPHIHSPLALSGRVRRQSSLSSSADSLLAVQHLRRIAARRTRSPSGLVLMALPTF